MLDASNDKEKKHHLVTSFINKGAKFIRFVYAVRQTQDWCYTLTLPKFFSHKFILTHKKISIEHSEHISNVFNIFDENLQH